MPIKCTCVRCAALAVPAGYEGIEISAAVVSVFSHNSWVSRDGQGMFVKGDGWRGVEISSI